MAKGMKNRNGGRVTLAEVSRIAGVSSATASMALADNAVVAENTRQRIKAVARQLGYVPHAAAASLASSKTSSIAIILADSRNPYSMEVGTGVEDELYHQNSEYVLGMYFTNRLPVREGRLLRMGLERRVDGMIVVPDYANENREVYENLIRANVPLVFFGGRPDFFSGQIDSVMADTKKGGRLAAEHFLKNGRRRLACLYPGEPTFEMNPRIRGFISVLQENGVAADLSLFRAAGRTLESFYEETKKLLRNSKFDGLFCYSDFVAMGAMRALAEENIKIPDDIAVVGFDNSPFSVYHSIGLTSVDCQVRECCRLTVQLLLDRIKRAKSPIREIVLEPSLVVRKSTM